MALYKVDTTLVETYLLTFKMTDYTQEFNVDAYTNIDKLKEHIKPYLEAYFMMRDEYEIVDTECNKLKEEIKELNEEVNSRVVIEDIADLFGSDEGDDFDWEDGIGAIILENKKLKRANELNAELHKTREEVVGVLEQKIKKLKEDKSKIEKEYIKMAINGCEPLSDEARRELIEQYQ